MFKATQIISATQLIRNFKRISWELSTHPQAILIMQKKGEHLVLVNAEIFEELMEMKIEQMQATGSSLNTPS